MILTAEGVSVRAGVTTSPAPACSSPTSNVLGITANTFTAVSIRSSATVLPPRAYRLPTRAPSLTAIALTSVTAPAASFCARRPASSLPRRVEPMST